MRYYSATAVRTQLTASISGSATVATVASTSGFPASVPFTLLLEPGQLTEEVVSVTSVGGLTLTLARGQDGTSAVPHDVGADIRHGLSARDLREPQEHIAAVNGVHGVDGNLVGDTDVQGLTNKAIDGNLNTLTNVPKTALPSDTVYTATSQTLTNKTLSGATNTITGLGVGALTARPYTINQRSGTTNFASSTTYATLFSWAATSSSGVTYTNGQWTIPVAGVYTLTGMVSFGANATGMRGVRTLYNGATVNGQVQVSASSASDYMSVPIIGGGFFPAGSTIEVQAYQSSGVALDVGAPGFFYLQYVSAA